MSSDGATVLRRPYSEKIVTEVLTGLDAGGRERIAALRAQGRFFWLDASLSETSRDELVDTLGVPESALEGRSRFRADAQSVDFALRCYVAMEGPADRGASDSDP